MLAGTMGRLRQARAADGYHRWERRTSGPMLALSLLFLVVLVLPLLRVDWSPAWETAFTVADAAIWLAFAVDYAARLYLAPDRWRFVRTHLVDLAVVLLPLLRPLRALRLLRLLRLVSLVGLVQRRARRSLHTRVTLYVGLSASLLLVVAAAVMYSVERDNPEANITSLADALWWAVVTVTTVGYGDQYPTTATGRAVAVVLMLMGIALLGVVTASIAAWFVERLRGVQEAGRRQQATLDDVLDRLTDVQAQTRRLHARLDALESDRATEPR